MAHVLYLTYDGMTDPLGQSQILPYLRGLSPEHQFSLISCEKKGHEVKFRPVVESLINESKINWHPLRYHKDPPILSTLWDLRKIESLAAEIHQKHPIDIIHCRSHLLAIVGERLKSKLGIPYLFDMRSFYPDERVDGNLWPQSNPTYRMIYNYFKRKEIEMWESCDGLVVLTETALKIIQSKNLPIDITRKTEVIPCCADFEHFNYKRFSVEDRAAARTQFDISANAYVTVYLGSIGTWYCLKEMLQFFKLMLKKRSDCILFFITPDAPEIIIEEAEKMGVPRSSLRITFAARNDVPRFLSICDLALYFIKNTYSKKASCPTKHAELMGMGLPMVVNTGIGDADKIINESNSGYIVDLARPDLFQNTVEEVFKSPKVDPEKIRAAGKIYFSLDRGVKSYRKVYSQILGGSAK